VKDGPYVVVELAPWFGEWFAGYRQRVEEGMPPNGAFIQFMIRLAMIVRPAG
jgi:hypothetical protein